MYNYKKFYKNKTNINTKNLSMYEYLLNNSELNRNLIALNYFNNKITYQNLLIEIDKCSKSLKYLGIKENDVVTICMPNIPEAVISLYAINKIGAVANIIHPLSSQEEIKNTLNDTDSVLLLTVDILYDKIKDIINKTSVFKVIVTTVSNYMPTVMKTIYNISNLFKKKIEYNSKFISYSEFFILSENFANSIVIESNKNKEALILHSGGTTGTPKNVVLTNGNINAIVEQAIIAFPEICEGDRFLSILPMFHCFGLVVCIHVPLCLNSTSILIPQFDVKQFHKLLKRYHPTVLPGVPTLFEALLINDKMDKIDLSELKYVISGGDSLSEEKCKKINIFLKDHKCKTEIKQGYGMTETSGPVCFGCLGSSKLGSVGIPLPGNDIKIIEPNTGIELGPDEIGEIYISGPTLMKEYLNNKKETDNLFRYINNKKYVHTGDLGYLDRDGVLFFVLRLKRMLICSGYNVYPSHIENTIMKHKAVEICAVVGIPHPYKVQEPKAYIVLKKEYKDTPELRKEIKEYCNKNLSKYMIPKKIEFKEELPKTLIGKVNYKELEYR